MKKVISTLVATMMAATTLGAFSAFAIDTMGYCGERRYFTPDKM